MFRAIGSKAGPYLRRAVVASHPSRGMCSRGRNLPVGFPRHRGWGLGMFDDLAGRMMDRHMRQMERMMDDVTCMGRGMGPARMWPKWAEFGGHGSGKGEVQHVKYNESEYEVKVDVSAFKPEELEVQIIKDRLTISGKQEEKADEHGYVSREFTRHFSVPEDVEQDTLETVLTNEGALIVSAKVKGWEQAEARKLDIKKEAPKDSE